MAADYLIKNEGSLIGIKPITLAAQEWWDDNVDVDSTYVLGGFTFGDHRPMTAIIEAMDAEGFRGDLA